jgi:hypothetical protein
MIDLGFSGNPYTWSNHRQGLGLIKERLDRCIASLEWIHTFSNFSINHLPAHTSDHNPLILDTSLPRPFQFEEFWSRDPSCGIVINEAWSTVVFGSPSYCLSKNLSIQRRPSNIGINISLEISVLSLPQPFTYWMFPNRTLLPIPI